MAIQSGTLCSLQLFAIREAQAGQAGRTTADQAHTTPSSEEAWLEKEAISYVQEVLDELDERERTLLVMKYSGFPYAELAKATGTPVQSVGTILARAKNKFRRLYERIRGEEG